MLSGLWRCITSRYRRKSITSILCRWHLYSHCLCIQRIWLLHSATQEIVVGKGYTILMPNAFSPNGDNINEIIGPVFTGLKSLDYFVYNKQGTWSSRVCLETNLSADGTIEIKGWDGTNSDPASNFYVYKLLVYASMMRL